MGYPLNDTNYNWERRRRNISGDSLIDTANSMSEEQKQEFREAIGAGEDGSKKIIIPTEDNTYEVEGGTYEWQTSSGGNDFHGDIKEFFLGLEGESGDYVLRIMHDDCLVNEYAVSVWFENETTISVRKNTIPTTEMITVVVSGGELETFGSAFSTYDTAISGHLKLEQQGGWVGEDYDVEYYNERDREIYLTYDPIMHAAATLYIASSNSDVFSFPAMIDNRTYVFFRDNENTTSTDSVYKEPITNMVLTFYTNNENRNITIS